MSTPRGNPQRKIPNLSDVFPRPQVCLLGRNPSTAFGYLQDKRRIKFRKHELT